jgi:raffinose/stachyose/melibiose transport system permease protein
MHLGPLRTAIMRRWQRGSTASSEAVLSKPTFRRSIRGLVPYLFVLPAFIIYGTFLLWPLVQLVVLSLEKWNGLTADREWAGFSNYERLIHDPTFWIALKHNIIWVAMSSIVISLGLVLAVILHQARPRGGRVYRVIFFLPYTLTSVLVGITWKWMYHPVWGPLNEALRRIGLGNVARGWLGDIDTALLALTVAANWVGHGFIMMLFLAGLANIDPVLYDAASVDGAGSWRKFRHVTLPGLANTLNMVILIVFIATVRVFDIVYVTTKGGPLHATEVLGTYIHWQTFENLEVGYGAAISVATAAIILGASLIYLKLRERGE